MSTPTFEVVTSMSQSYYDKIGNVMLNSWIEKWPEDVKLRVYTEDGLKLPQHPKYEVYDVFKEEPELRKFVERHKDRPDQQNPKELHLGAVRFSYKTFSIINACLNKVADYVIWLDADTLTHTDVTIDFLESIVDDNKYLTYLGRENNYSECGFVIYNTNHPCNDAFMSRWKMEYTHDGVFSYPQWHDSYVFDQIRKLFESDKLISNINLTPWGKDYDHVFINSVLGEYMDHMKGPRKDTGSSNKSDLFVEKKAKYWSNIK
jgi:hypothetical protein